MRIRGLLAVRPICLDGAVPILSLLQRRYKATTGFGAGILYSVANSVRYTGNNTFGLLAAPYVYLACMCYVDTCHGICGYKTRGSKYLHLEA